jgi:DNA-directed RNA polymerase subunit RPC12/RpoP
MDERLKLINKGLICPYCGESTEFINSSYVYGKSHGMIYICKQCDAHVGVHKGSTISLGRLANEELRTYKKAAHLYFDKIAKTGAINIIYPQYIEGVSNRSKAYKWLAEQMDMPEELCHIGMMNKLQCSKVIEICKKYESILT